MHLFDMIHQANLLTPRLRLRQWRLSDLEPLAAMNSDPDVMRYYPAPWAREQSDAFAQRVMGLIDERGWGFWAVEERASGRFIGFVGLHVPSQELPFSPCVEVGWRLARSYWVCHGGGASSRCVRIRATPSGGTRGIHRHHQPEIERGDGTPRDAARLRIRPPPGAHRIRAASACVVSSPLA